MRKRRNEDLAHSAIPPAPPLFTSVNDGLPAGAQRLLETGSRISVGAWPGWSAQADAKQAVSRCFVFVRVDCPISNRYAPELRRIHESLADSVSWWLVYPNPHLDPEQMAQHVAEYELPGNALS